MYDDHRRRMAACRVHPRYQRTPVSTPSHQDPRPNPVSTFGRCVGGRSYRPRRHVRHSVVVSHPWARAGRQRPRRQTMPDNYPSTERAFRTSIVQLIFSRHWNGAQSPGIWIIRGPIDVSELWHVRCLKFWGCSKGTSEYFSSTRVVLDWHAQSRGMGQKWPGRV